ncbi:hypothetical protein D9611_014718 [Ephemerocybe angulata]|uniref:BED-type domain-containing protein n=1 Tax=Ephemerocybe angulata TaxID=980116 RepID=A0A8H5F012_9AGAR|nr:hypothetical protein D9611_014718 [Tulosesus angulatus]
MAPRDQPDTSLIIDEPRKRKLRRPHDEDSDTEPAAKKAKSKPAATSKPKTIPTMFTAGRSATTSKTSTSPAPSVRGSSPAPSMEEVEDEDAGGGSLRNRPPRKPTHIIESDDEEDEEMEGDEEMQEDGEQGDGDDAEAKGDDIPGETEEQKLERISKEWTSAAYAFYNEPTLSTYENRPCQVFICGKCLKPQRRFTETSNATSTGNLKKHAEKCWGKDIVKRAYDARTTLQMDLESIKEGMKNATWVDGSITASFERKGKGALQFSARNHTYKERRVEIVRWLAESLRSSSIIGDRGFQVVMKTGRPHIKLPSRWTVARDIHKVFLKTEGRISKLLQNYDGRLSFATDCWTSPNNRAFCAITVHLEHEGKPLSLLLDIVELAKSHNGANLAEAFAAVLERLNISEKLRKVALAIKNSPTIVAPRWKKILEDIIKAQSDIPKLSPSEKITMRNMPTDVATRWNSTFMMLCFAVKYRKAIDMLTADRNMKLRDYELDNAEWDIASQLSEALEKFYEATMKFSKDEPSLAAIIPAIDKIDKHLASCAINKEYSPALQAAFSLGKKLLNKYYALSDMSDVYRIAIEEKDGLRIGFGLHGVSGKVSAIKASTSTSEARGYIFEAALQKRSIFDSDDDEDEFENTAEAIDDDGMLDELNLYLDDPLVKTDEPLECKINPRIALLRRLE